MHRDRINISFVINSAMYTLVVGREYDYKNRFFGLCESCYWTAILREIETFHCPVCHSQEVALIPLSNDERYEYSLEPKQGIQIKFSLLSKELSK